MWQINLGIEVELVNQDWKVYLNREMIGDFQISRAGWIGDYEDPNTFLDLMRLTVVIIKPVGRIWNMMLWLKKLIQ